MKKYSCLVALLLFGLGCGTSDESMTKETDVESLRQDIRSLKREMKKEMEELKTLLASKEVGPCLIEDKKHNALYILNHFEYDSDTLKQEYDRDVEEGKKIILPQNYYPDDDPQNNPKNRWRSHAHLLYGNWINEIYQTTPYDLNKIGT